MKTTLNFYYFEGNFELGNEPLGTFHKGLFHDLTTVRGAINRIRSLGWKHFTIFQYSNLYDETTFRKVYQ